MRNVGIFLSVLFVASGAMARDVGAMARAGKSFLSPQKFPTVFNDASFTTRMNILAQGYEPWESEFDSSGRCIRGCAYHGITIEDELDAMQRKTNQVVNELQVAGHLPQSQPPIVPQPTVVSSPVIPVVPVSQPPEKPVPNTPTEQIVQAVSCQPNQPNIPPGQLLPLGEPVQGNPTISSPFGRRTHPVTGNQQNHSGVDLAVPVGTNVFSPANGRVVNVWTDNTCGRGVKIAHADGYETVYCHLSQVQVSIGDTVSAGCRVALSGNTGRSTGPHLHYAIKKDGTFINPARLMGR